MMSQSDIARSARTLSNMIRVDMPMDEAAEHMSEMIPKHRAAWQRISNGVSAGQSLSALLRDEGLWPEAYIRAVEAGEASDSMAQALAGVYELITEVGKIRKTVVSKMVAPFVYLMGGALVFLVYVVFVFPSATQALQEDQRTGLIEFMDGLNHTLVNDWYVYLGGVVALGVGLALFFQNENNRTAVMRLLRAVPVLGTGLNEIFASVWARYMALLDRAGDIAYDEMLRLATPVIPKAFQDGFLAMERDLEGSRSLIDAVDTSNLPANDARQRWPVLMKIALKNAATTGETGGPLGEAVEPLAEEGMGRLSIFLAIANGISLLVAAFGILVPFLLLALVQMSAMDAMR